MKPEYKEGAKAKRDFERTMIALFKTPKTPNKKTAKVKVKPSRKSGKDV